MHDALIDAAKAKLEESRRVLVAAAGDFSVSDVNLLELRDRARQADEELQRAERLVEKKGLLSFLKFW